MQFPRTLNLDDPSDRAEFSSVLSGSPDAALASKYLDDYLSLFPEASWRLVHYDGSVVVNTGGRGRFHLAIGQALCLTKTLRSLGQYRGFESLLRGFRNPSQFFATLFEVSVAEWCSSRLLTIDLEFSPPILVKGATKRPDLLWHTALGSLYVECKRSTDFEHKFSKRLNRLHQALESEYGKHASWNNALRLDITIVRAAKNGVEHRLANAVAWAAGNQGAPDPESLRFEQGEVVALIRDRIRDPAIAATGGPGNILCVASVTVGATPVGLNDAHVRIQMDVGPHRANAAVKLIRDARTQLPTTSKGAIFLQIGGGEIVTRRISALMAAAPFRYVPWIATWDDQEVRAAWRNYQPFDGRLLLEKPKGVVAAHLHGALTYIARAVVRIRRWMSPTLKVE